MYEWNDETYEKKKKKKKSWIIANKEGEGGRERVRERETHTGCLKCRFLRALLPEVLIYVIQKQESLGMVP